MENNFDVMPTMIHRKNGEWLAISPLSYNLKIGVIAETKEGARVKFNHSLSEWVLNLENNGNISRCASVL